MEKAAAGNGSIAMPDDRDNVIRRLPLFFNLRETIYPSLAAEALRVAQGATLYKIKLSGGSGERAFGERTGIVKVRIGKLTIPTDKHGRVWLYDTGDQPERYLPAWKVLSDDFDLASLEGTLLFIGTSAAGLKDLRSTPLNPRAPGVKIHAGIAEQILLQNFLERPDWAEGAEFSYLVLLGLILILLLPRAGAVLCAAVGITAVTLAMGLSWYAFDRHHLLTDPVFPSLVIFLIYLVSSFLNFLRTECEKSQIRGAFSRYLSPALVAKPVKDPKQLKLGGETRTMTFLFSDIRSFTSLSETMTAQELTKFMNHYMTPMTDIILKHGGTIDKHIGDCIMAFWNAPLGDKDHAKHACLAAIEMQQFLREWNALRKREAEERGKPFLEIKSGVGINTGEACVGNMGSEHRFDYTVLGDDVNFASRLEGASKNYGTTTILGANTMAGVPEMRPWKWT
ncbi:MAG: adenylate/guanylate cyclase domain-containing protein [Candidatus Omnitrophota bacterium]